MRWCRSDRPWKYKAGNQSSSTFHVAFAGPLLTQADCCVIATPRLGQGCENELKARMEEIGREYAAAREHGDFNVAGVIAGESYALIHDIPPPGDS